MSSPNIDHLKKLDTLLANALERSKDERTAFLRMSCGDDVALYNEVVALLESSELAIERVGDSALAFAAPLLEKDTTDVQDEPLNEELGPYRLLREVGRGGMGAVYLAERSDGVHSQKVALKAVKKDLSQEFVRRFKSEREILASLNHPGIARLLDGGDTEDGRSFLVMEYVDGESITSYADRKKLPIEQRLSLFEDVCEAVAYAHRNLVVHRDLKPSNVLVGDDANGKPAVKLLDFGIAKLVESESDSAQTTTLGGRLMTPDYAAPEQVRGDAVSTSTDVYALGVLLYRLLTGHRPYHITEKGRFAVEQAILSAKPIDPSSSVLATEERTQKNGSATTIAPESIAASRSTSPQRLSRDLKGDLDTIVQKALRKEPARRYGSAEALARDIQRYRDGLPVEARPDSFRYRVSKFVGRHKAGVGVGSLAVLLILSAAGLATWQARVASDERIRAEEEADKSKQVVTLLSNILTAANPMDLDGPDVPVGQLLEQSLPEMRESLVDQPAILATVLSVVGIVEDQWGRVDEAEALMDEAKSLIDSTEVSQETRLDVLSRVIQIYTNTNRLEEAEPMQREILDLQLSIYGGLSNHVASAFSELARIVERKGDLEEAESHYLSAIAIRRETGESAMDLAANLNNLGSLYVSESRYGEAEQRFMEALGIVEHEVGFEHPAAAFLFSGLSVAQQNQSKFDEAMNSIERSIEIRTNVFGAESAPVAVSMHNRASLLRDMNRNDEALEAFQEALLVRRQAVPDGDPDLAFSLNGLGGILNILNRAAESEPHYREAVEIRRAVLPYPHWQTAISEGGLASSLVKQGRFSEAEPLLTGAYRTMLEEFGEDNDRTHAIAERFVEFYELQGMEEEAQEWRMKAGLTE